jgi:hypothetical protein
MQYVHTMSPEPVAQLSSPASIEVQQMMENNITSLLGGLPSQHFDVEITTNRESLGRLLSLRHDEWLFPAGGGASG